MEFLAVLDGIQTSRLLVIPPYNSTEYRFASYPQLSTSGLFEPMVKLINKTRALQDGTPIAPHFEQAGALRYGDLQGSRNHWLIEGDSIFLRIPWSRINVSDPSQGRVIDDEKLYYSDPLRDILATRLSDGIAVSLIMIQNPTGNLLDVIPESDRPEQLLIPWSQWNEPIFQERLKSSYFIIRDYLLSKTEPEE
jgi:hypothetical protein